jgi:exopolyphosphatase/guanosine-5'-triphosphate,3'-diphosphate pyrophosphatase
MRLACIDVGTNSAKLIVADVKNHRIVKVVSRKAVTTRMGQGVNRFRKLSPEAIDRTIKAVINFKEDAEQLGVAAIIPVATGAIREAQNRDDFVRAIADRTKLELTVLSGKEEARLAYMGTCSDPKMRSERIIFVDIGGGSSDFVLGQNGDVEYAFSVNIGFIRLNDEFIHSHPVEPDELQSTVEYVKSALYKHLSKISMDDRKLIGTGGTILNLAAIYQNMYSKAGIPAGDIHGYILSREEVDKMLRHLSKMKLEDRKKIPGLPPARADIIVAGVAIISAIMELLNAEKITVSARSMRYGVLLSYSAR